MTWNWKNIMLLTSGMAMLYLVGLFSLYILINPIIFKTERTRQYNAFRNNRIQEIQIPLPGEQHLIAQYHQPRSTPHGVVLLLHGAQGNLDDYQFLSQVFVSRGYAVLLPDFRGFGKSAGNLTETSLEEDALACMDWINKRFREDSILLYAMDFLSPVACYVNTMMPARMLILDNPVYGLKQWVRDRYPAFFLPYELKYDFKLYEFLPNCLSPVFVIRPQHQAYTNPMDAANIQQMLRDPSSFFQMDDQKSEKMHELESYFQIIDQIMGKDAL